jgi:hypothetical protein
MAAELGGKQLSTLLESLPGIASVLRSPVADAIVGMIRAGAGMADFRESDAKELIHYATRRGLMGSEEGDQLLAEIKARGRHTKAKAVKKATKKPAKAPKAAKVSKSPRKAVKAAKKTTTRKTAVKKTKTKRARKKRP